MGIIVTLCTSLHTTSSTSMGNTLHIQHATYIGSYIQESQCPRDGKPEFAFIGRSNVGKSSLINMLVGRKKLAKVSNTPGKTQTLNFFDVDRRLYIVDLPGYGYAKISKTKRKEWSRMVHAYLQKRATLQVAFVLLDANIPLQQNDIEFLNWCGEAHIPIALVYTKLDRMRHNKQQKNLAAIRKGLLEYWESLPPQFETSAVDGTGREQMWAFINELTAQYYARQDR